MNTRNLVLGSAMLVPLFLAKPVQAQRVRADIVIGGGPIAGRVTVGDQGRGAYGRPRPIRGIELIRSQDYRRNDWWGQFERGSRIVVVYYDPYEDAYYQDRFSPDLVELRLFERDGRFYRLEDDGYGFPEYIRGYSFPRYEQRYQTPRYYPQYQTPRYDDRRYDNQRRDGWGVDRRDNRSDGRINPRDNRNGGGFDPRGNRNGGGFDPRGDRQGNRGNQDNRGTRGSQDNRGNRSNQDNRDHRGQRDPHGRP